MKKQDPLHALAQWLVPGNQNLKLSCQGGDARIISLTVHELESAGPSG
jgi:hypothetical protein